MAGSWVSLLLYSRWLFSCRAAAHSRLVHQEVKKMHAAPCHCEPSAAIWSRGMLAVRRYPPRSHEVKNAGGLRFLETTNGTNHTNGRRRTVGPNSCDWCDSWWKTVSVAAAGRTGFVGGFGNDSGLTRRFC